MEKVHFEKLTATKDVELRIYNDALNFIFENDDIRNVGISGSYGAGKSSVIESYKKTNEKKFIHISLANFEDENRENDVQNNVIEGKILNQLLHQIKESQIPQTNFKVKHKISRSKSLLEATITILFFIASLHIYFYSQWSSYVDFLSENIVKRIFKLTTQSTSLIFSGSIIAIVSWRLVYRFIRVWKSNNLFKSLKFQGNEIEVFEKSDESYFDKYLNEVLYLFDNSGANVIVFEDIDRYNVNQIFQRLREINILVNIKREKEKQDPLRFFYLIKDDIFISKERTKFFDFIMPVVPVMDGSNAYDNFIKHLKEGGVFKYFDNQFLQGISLYVDDMRILKNIYNEFIVYNNRIGTTEQDYNKLLAIIVYKNIFPRDFNDTQLNIGFISTLFLNKEYIIRDAINTIDIKIENLEEELRECDKEHLNSIEELNKLYGKRDYYGNISINVNDEIYIRRKKTIELIESNNVTSLTDEIESLKQKKIKLNSKKLHEIITRENKDEVFNISYKNFLGDTNEFKEIKGSQYFDLIKYLICNCYIDETYEDYMTYFYPNSLTRNDKIFLRSITDMKAKPWKYEINNLELVISRLREVDFNEIETLNFELFSYILKNKDKNEKYLNIFIEQLKRDKQFKFMQEYFNWTKDKVIYIQTINIYWPSFLEEIYNREEFSYNEIKEIILITLYNSSSEEINEINKNDALTQIISMDDEFLNVEEINCEKLVVMLLTLNVKFRKLDYEKSNKELFALIYQHKLYEFNFDNISLMLKEVYKFKNDEDIFHKNYSIIVRNKESELLEYVNENIEQYIEYILQNCNGSIFDESDAVLELINNSQISTSNKKQYIKYLKTKLERLEEVKEKELWDLLLENEIVEYLENNILYYYYEMGNKLNEILIAFINNSCKELKFSIDKIDEVFGERSSESFFNSVIICESISNDKYRNIINCIKRPYLDFKFEGISNEKVIILIELGVIKMTSNNIRFMRHFYNEEFINFMVHNIEEYLNNLINIEKITYDEVLKILDCKIKDEDKIRLIEYVDGPIAIYSKKYSDEVKIYIIENNFEQEELIKLIGDYEKMSHNIRKVLGRACIQHIDIINYEKVILPIGLFEDLLSQKSISIENRINLIINNISRFSKAQCEKYMKSIENKEYEKILGNGRPKLENLQINIEILKAFKEKGWISDYSEENGYIKVKRRKIK